jgi:bifunctional non-homologous end joining protein LigD
MSLKSYKTKRNLDKTPEPKAVKKSSKKHLLFVVQKHAARNLHYDFRLELDGVLKSWAVPKGPPKTNEEKRLAIQVEDHPLAYADFHGVIPEGHYGAGTVEIWDNGYYEPAVEALNLEDQEKILRDELRKGTLKIIMHGKKLKGEFALVHMKTDDQKKNNWLLIKATDPNKKKKALKKDPKLLSG